VRQRLVWAAVFTAAFALALIAVVGRHDFAWSHGYMLGGSGPVNVNGHPLALGDHLQVTYYLWLWWDGLIHGRLPVHDPYQFALTGHHTLIVLGWPLVVLFVPITAIAGPVAAFNATVVVGFFASAVCAYLLARALGISRAGGLVAALAYAFAPWRLIQSGHIGTYLGFLPPLILYLAEHALRSEKDNVRWAWGCAAAYVSLAASGDLHTTLYTTPILVTFVIVRAIGLPRERLRSLLPAGVALVALSGLAVGAQYHFLLSRVSHNQNAVNINLAPRYAPRLSGLFQPRRGSEQYDYPGAVIAILATLGAISAFFVKRTRALSLWFVAVIGVAYAIAMAPAFPAAFKLIKALPLTGFIRVPGRDLVVAVLALAILAGFGISTLERKVPAWVVLPIVLVLLVGDVRLAGAGFAYTSAGDDVLASVPKDAGVMDLPPFPPWHHGGSRYMLDITRHPGPRANGYNVLVPDDVWASQRQTWTLATLPVDPCAWKRLSTQMHFTYTAVHTDLFGPPPYWPIAEMTSHPVTAPALVKALDATPGFHRVSVVDETAVYHIVPAELRCR
jgi:hypothetical protein